MAGFKILVVGGGVAGLEMATRLGRGMGRLGEAEITLVDRALAHVWKPMLHTFAAGTSSAPQEQVAFIAQARRNAFRFWPGEIAAVDRERRVVTLEPLRLEDGQVLDGATLDYDALILAIGSRANDFGTPGVLEHCLFVDDLTQALRFNDFFRSRVLAAAAGSENGLDIAIVGGGATGTELAAEISRALEIADSYDHGAIRHRLRLALIEAGPRILPAFPPSVSDQATTELKRLGLGVFTGAEVVSVDPGGLVLKDGKRLQSELTVWAAGIKGADILQRLGLETSKFGQLAIRSSLQTTQDPRVFAIGDCATLIYPGQQRPVPATAQVAHAMAKHLAKQLPGWLRSDAPLPAFRYSDKGSIVSLGPYGGWGTLGRYGFFTGREFRGWLASAGHQLLYREHQIMLNGLLRGLLVWFAGSVNAAIKPGVRLD